jgi:hypothetical protein
MRWKRVAIGAVLGGLLGLGGQLVADYFLWITPIRKTPHQTFDNPLIPRMKGVYFPATSRRDVLVYRGFLLWWLLLRGDVGSPSILLVAFIGASAALALDRKGKDSLVRSSSKETLVAAISVAEPKDNASEHEPVEKPAQIEITEQAVVLKTASKKECTEA